jgi:hypothetical protein
MSDPAPADLELIAETRGFRSEASRLRTALPLRVSASRWAWGGEKQRRAGGRNVPFNGYQIGTKCPILCPPKIARGIIGAVVIGHYPLNHHPARLALEDVEHYFLGWSSIAPAFSVFQTTAFVLSSLGVALLVDSQHPPPPLLLSPWGIWGQIEWVPGHRVKQGTLACATFDSGSAS